LINWVREERTSIFEWDKVINVNPGFLANVKELHWVVTSLIQLFFNEEILDEAWVLVSEGCQGCVEIGVPESTLFYVVD
jgi:hypothetical protein